MTPSTKIVISIFGVTAVVCLTFGLAVAALVTAIAGCR